MLIQKVPGASFSSDLPMLYKDAVINSGTQFVFDVLDDKSWQSQATPTGDDLLNLVDGGDSATVSTNIEWDNGFKFDEDSDVVVLPSSGVLAEDQDAFLFIVWVKHLANPSGLTSGVAGVAVSNVNSQYFITSATSGVMELSFAAPGGYAFSPDVGGVYQLGVSAKRNEQDTAYDIEYFVDGSKVLEATNSVDSLYTGTTAKLGNITQGAGYADDWSGVIYRSVMDYLTAGKTAAEIVALDYSENTERFG